jgi:hypothetical protein
VPGRIPPGWRSSKPRRLWWHLVRGLDSGFRAVGKAQNGPRRGWSEWGRADKYFFIENLLCRGDWYLISSLRSLASPEARPAEEAVH